MFLMKMELRFAILVMRGPNHRATEIDSDALHTVTDAENRKPQIVDCFVHFESIFVIHGSGTAAQNNTFGIFRFDLFDLGEIGNNFAVDLLFAKAARNELRILRTEVENYDTDIFQNGVLDGRI